VKQWTEQTSLIVQTSSRRARTRASWKGRRSQSRTTEAAAAGQRADSRFADALRSTSAGTTTPSSPCYSRWCCSSLLRRLGWAVRALNGHCSEWRSPSLSQPRWSWPPSQSTS